MLRDDMVYQSMKIKVAYVAYELEGCPRMWMPCLASEVT